MANAVGARYIGVACVAGNTRPQLVPASIRTGEAGWPGVGPAVAAAALKRPAASPTSSAGRPTSSLVRLVYDLKENRTPVRQTVDLPPAVRTAVLPTVAAVERHLMPA